MTRTEIERLLPTIFQRALGLRTPLDAFLHVMEVLHAPSEKILAELEATFDPRRTPNAFVPFLAQWVGVQYVLEERYTGNDQVAPRLGHFRELVAASVSLGRWQGTSWGLRRFLETATGVTGFVIDEHVRGADGNLRPFHIKVQAPKDTVADRDTASYRALIERVIAAEKPAAVTCEVEFDVSTQSMSATTSGATGPGDLGEPQQVFEMTSRRSTQEVRATAAMSGQITLTVKNVTNHPLHARARILVEAEAQESWFEIAGGATRDFLPEGVQQYLVHIEVPAGTAEGTYSFRLRVVAENQGREASTDSPALQLTVVSLSPSPAPVPSGAEGS